MYYMYKMNVFSIFAAHQKNRFEKNHYFFSTV